MTLHGSCTSIYNNSKLNTAYKNVNNFPKSYSYNNDSIFTGYSNNNNSKMSGFETAALVFAGLTGLAAPLVSLIGLFKRDNNTNTNNTDNKTETKNDTKTTETAVKNPADSLEKAISDCRHNGKVDELKAKAEADSTAQKADAAKIGQMTRETEAAYKTANDELKTLNESYDKAEGKLEELKGNEKDAEKEATKADKAFESAQKGVANAKAAVSAATTPEAKTAAEEDLKIAEINLNSAEKNQTEANKAKAEAQRARADQEKEVSGLAEKVKAQKEKVDAAKKAFEKSKSEQTKLQAVNDRWAQTLKEAQAELAKYNTSSTLVQDKKDTINSTNVQFKNFKSEQKPAETKEEDKISEDEENYTFGSMLDDRA